MQIVNIADVCALQAMQRHKMVHPRFTKLAGKLAMQEPPCMSDAEDWESQHGWVDELVPPPLELASMPSLPDATGVLPDTLDVRNPIAPPSPPNFIYFGV
jgi:hypothetical protein